MVPNSPVPMQRMQWTGGIYRSMWRSPGKENPAPAEAGPGQWRDRISPVPSRIGQVRPAVWPSLPLSCRRLHRDAHALRRAGRLGSGT